MRRALLLLLLAAACRSVPAVALTGAESPRGAVDRFLAAARAQDMQALSVVWGNEKGPQRDQIDRSQLEQREVIMITLLRHDQSIIGQPVRAPNNRVNLTVDLKQGSRTASPVFTVVRGPSSRWYVETFDLQMLQNKGFGTKP